MSDTQETGRDLLKHFGLITEDQLAGLLGVSIKTLKNRSRYDLPDFVKSGRKRLFKEESVREYLDSRMVRSPSR